MAGDKTLKLLDKDYLTAREVPGYPGYLVSISGRIYSVKELKPRLHSDGYLRVCLYGKIRGKKRQGVHQLLALTYLTPGPKDREVRHLDGDKYNNRIENLAWGTRKSNAQDMARHGSVRGEKNPKAILKKDQVLEIRKRHFNGEKSRSKFAKEFGVSVGCIERVLSRRNWKHL